MSLRTDVINNLMRLRTQRAIASSPMLQHEYTERLEHALATTHTGRTREDAEHYVLAVMLGTILARIPMSERTTEV
jgi:hypothetical protein